MKDVTFPKDRDFAKTLSDLLGREVKVKALATAASLAPAESFIGGYDDGLGTMEAGWVSDLPASVSLAAALTLVPAGVAKEAVQTKVVSADLQENVREVVNIAANSFIGKRVRLVEFCGPKGSLAAAWSEWLQRAARTAHYEVSVVGYLPGRVSLSANAASPEG